MQLALESCSLESTGRLLESVSNYRSIRMVIRFRYESNEKDRIRLLIRPMSIKEILALLRKTRETAIEKDTVDIDLRD